MVEVTGLEGFDLLPPPREQHGCEMLLPLKPLVNGVLLPNVVDI